MPEQADEFGPLPLPLWEATDQVRFGYREVDGLWFQCPHMPTAHRLPIGPSHWQVHYDDSGKLWVTPSIHMHCQCYDPDIPGMDTSKCSQDCHGFIQADVWKPV